MDVNEEVLLFFVCFFENSKNKSGGGCLVRRMVGFGGSGWM